MGVNKRGGMSAQLNLRYKRILINMYGISMNLHSLSVSACLWKVGITFVAVGHGQTAFLIVKKPITKTWPQ